MEKHEHAKALTTAHAKAQKTAQAAAQALAVSLGMHGPTMDELSRPSTHAPPPVNTANDFMSLHDEPFESIDRMIDFDELFPLDDTNDTASTSPSTTPPALDDHAAPNNRDANEPLTKKARHQSYDDAMDFMMEEHVLSHSSMKSDVVGFPKPKSSD